MGRSALAAERPYLYKTTSQRGATITKAVLRVVRVVTPVLKA